MIITRIFRPLASRVRNFSTSNVQKGGHKVYFRTPPDPPSKYHLIGAEAVGGLMWWWILWHLWTEPEHIIGDFPYPDPTKWTDEELGIPPLDED